MSLSFGVRGDKVTFRKRWTHLSETPAIRLQLLCAPLLVEELLPSFQDYGVEIKKYASYNSSLGLAHFRWTAYSLDDLHRAPASLDESLDQKLSQNLGIHYSGVPCHGDC